MNIQQIEALLAAATIYNADYVEMKTALNRILEKAKDEASAVYLAIPYEDGAKLAISHYSFAINCWAPKALPSERRA